MKYINTINKISEALIKIDKSGKDFRITKNEFDKIKDNLEIITILTGKKYKTEIDWEVFKNDLILYQSEFGFEWNRSKGQFGTIKLDEVDLIEEIGEEIATELKKKDKKNGNINDLLKSYLSSLYKYIYSNNNDSKIIRYYTINVRNGIRKNKIKGNKKFLFTSSSPKFELKNEEYSFSGSENELGDLIEAKLGELCKLDYIEHSQVKRKRGKFENVDLEGYKIFKSVTNDDLEVYNFELKKTNSITDISSAISQAVNYKKFAHYTYIVIPFMSQQNFYEKDRFNYFINLCKENKIGVISIIIDKNHLLEELNFIYEAPKTEMFEINHANELLAEEEKEYCVVCNKIVHTGINRKDDCAWLTNISDKESICQKELQEKNSLHLMSFLKDKGFNYHLNDK